MNKRSFLFLLHSALGFGLLCSSATAANVPGQTRLTNPFFAFDNGVGRDLKWPPERQAALLRDLGYDGIGYTGMEQLAERQKAFRERGLKIFSLYVPCYVDKPSPYDPQLKEAMQQLKDTKIILWLTIQGTSTNDDNAVRVVREIADEARASGLRVALYPHKGFFVATAKDALRIVRKLDRPNVGVTLNLCHELAAGNGEQIESIVKACAPHLFLVSINGADRSGDWDQLIRPLDEGNYDVAGFLKVLGQIGYTGPIGLQCYNLKGDPVENLKRSITAWQRLSTSLAPGQSRTALEVIPQPRKIKFTGSAYDPAATKVIRVFDNTANRFAAGSLQKALRETHGVHGNVIPIPQPTTNLHQVWLGLKHDMPDHPELPPLAKKEGYNLIVKPPGVLISAESDTGLFYGVQTLIQVLEQSRRDQTGIPGMVITDWPTFDWRGRYYDGSQYLGTIVTTRANLEREIKLMARSKLNFLILEMYNLAPFKSFPACADANTLSLADWQYLVGLAHRCHVTLIPSLQSFAQVYQVIWNCDAGKPYREETAPGLICPSRPENIQFLGGLYRDLISLFKYSPVLGIGCSEVGMQWQKRYCPRCKDRFDQGETLQDVYLRHVHACANAVEVAANAAGRTVRPLMWADEFYCGYDNQRWVGIGKIPTNTLMGHWQYWSRYQNLPTHTNKNYDGISGLLERGFDVLFLSASFEFNTYLHDHSPAIPADGKWELLLDSGIENIADQARWADAHQRKHPPGKMWGGGCATFSQHDIRCWDTTWFAYFLQAEYSWGDPARPLDHELRGFIDRFAAIFYGARDRKTARTIATAWRELDAAKNDIERNNYLVRDILGEYDIHDNFYNGNNLEASLKLLDELAAKPKGPGKTIEEIRRRCETVLRIAASSQTQLAACLSQVQNATSLHYLISAAHKMENHAQRTLLLIDLADAFQQWDGAKAPEARSKTRNKFASLQPRLKSLRSDTRVIADEMDQLAYGSVSQLIWEGTSTERLNAAASSDTTGYRKALASLDAFSRRIADILKTAEKP